MRRDRALLNDVSLFSLCETPYRHAVVDPGIFGGGGADPTKIFFRPRGGGGVGRKGFGSI